MRIVGTDKKSLTEVASALRQGAVIAYPTETVYGLGCDATNKQAVVKIFKIKGRAAGKALPLLASSVAMVREYFLLPTSVQAITKRYWPTYVRKRLGTTVGKPGPLACVLNYNATGKKALGRVVNTMSDDAVVRISSHKLATVLVRRLGVPLVSTSANPSGKPAALSASEVYEYFRRTKHKPDIIVDGGVLRASKGSTIIDVRDGSVTIVRQGDVFCHSGRSDRRGAKTRNPDKSRT